MTRIKLCLLVLLLGVVACNKSPHNNTPPVTDSTTFKNPLLPSGPDPWVIQYNGYYYYMNTLGDRIALYKTKEISDLVNAEVKTVWSAPSAGANSENVWAPELHHLQGKWYIYYTAGDSPGFSTQRTFVLENTATDPFEGTWTEKAQIADASANFYAIDGTVLEYNNKDYFIWSGWQSATNANQQRLYIARMLNPWTLESPRTLISAPTYSWEKNGALPEVNEGPEALINPAGSVFITYSASGCWTDDYALGLISLKENGDPLNATDWTKTPTPVFVKKPENGAFGPGHNSFFKSPDGTEDWIIYHANSSSGLGCGDARNPRMQKFTWNADGTPNFGEPVKINSPVKKPSGE